jgi:hypothetical protein
MCEASALLRAPWTGAPILVADNEISDALFSFTLDDDGFLGDQRDLPLPAGAPDDIEAMTVIGGQLLLFGSHSRNARCEPRPRRQRIQILRWSQERECLDSDRVIDSAAVWRPATASAQDCLDHLFTTPAPEGAKLVCEAIVDAEREARRGSCMPFDLEAATAVPDAATSEARVWVGLRRPRADGNAVLLRMTPELDRLRFDGVALLAVGDRGVRGLAADSGWMWAIIGPAADRPETSSIWRTPVTSVVPGALVSGETVYDRLPPSSEGLLVDDRHVLIVVDGDEAPHPRDPCATSAGQVLVVFDRVSPG